MLGAHKVLINVLDASCPYDGRQMKKLSAKSSRISSANFKHEVVNNIN